MRLSSSEGSAGAVSVVPAVTWVPGVPGIPGGSAVARCGPARCGRGCGSSGGRGRATGLTVRRMRLPSAPHPAHRPHRPRRPRTDRRTYHVDVAATLLQPPRCHIDVVTRGRPRCTGGAACTMRTTGTVCSRARPLTPEEPHPYDVEPVKAGTICVVPAAGPGPGRPAVAAGLPGPALLTGTDCAQPVRAARAPAAPTRHKPYPQADSGGYDRAAGADPRRSRGRRCPIPASYGSCGVALWRGEGERDDPRGHGWRGGGARRRATLPGGGQQGSPVRRRVLHRGDLDWYLLPTVLPGDHAETPEHAVLPECGRGPGGGLSGLQRSEERRVGKEGRCR